MTTVPAALPRKELTLLDSTCLIVGVIVGAGIYQVGPDVAKSASGPLVFLGLWLIGGLLSLCGALSYAELATTYPQEGGDYNYLNRAYGPWAGFLFGWIQVAIVRPGDIAVMAFAFATYARTIYDPLGGAYAQQLYAALAVGVLTAINIASVHQGKWTQNILTFAKVAGLVGIIAVALFAPRPTEVAGTLETVPLTLAMILILFTFGGWNEMVYVAAEVVNPRRNILRAMVLGIGAVTLLYLLVNGAFLYALGHSGLAISSAVAADTVGTVLGGAAPAVISALVCVSALGAVNGLIFAGARISYAVGRDHPLFHWVGHWDPHRGTPAKALLVQALIAVLLISVLGGFVDTLLYTAAPVYLFYLATNLAVIVLRGKDPQADRPYRVWGYPITPVLFSGTCAFLAYSAVVYKPVIALVALGLLLLGFPVYWLSNRMARSHPPTRHG